MSLFSKRAIVVACRTVNATGCVSVFWEIEEKLVATPMPTIAGALFKATVARARWTPGHSQMTGALLRSLIADLEHMAAGGPHEDHPRRARPLFRWGDGARPATPAPREGSSSVRSGRSAIRALPTAS